MWNLRQWISKLEKEEGEDEGERAKSNKTRLLVEMEES
jgi:hypothetical protein